MLYYIVVIVSNTFLLMCITIAVTCKKTSTYNQVTIRQLHGDGDDGITAGNTAVMGLIL